MAKGSLASALLTILAALLSSHPPATAATVSVCRSGCMYSLIEEGIAAADDGDTVLVGEGTYVENIIVDGLSVTLRSVSGPASTVIDGSARRNPDYGSVVAVMNGANVICTPMA